MVQRSMGGPEFSIDCLGDLDGRCLNAIPRTMLESRGGESIKGTVIDDAELIELGRNVVEALGVRGPCTVQAFRDPEIGLGITDVNTRFGGAFPAPMYAALPGPHLPGADRADGGGRDGRAARRRVPRGHDVHALVLADRARRARCAHGPRHRPRRAGRPPLEGPPRAKRRTSRWAGLESPRGHVACREPTGQRRGAGGRCRRQSHPRSLDGDPGAGQPGLWQVLGGVAPDQEWCLQCGAGAPGSVGSSGLGSLATVLAVTVVLVLGAAAAAFAALSSKRHQAPLVTKTVAQAPPAATAPVTPGIATTPGTSVPTVPGLTKPPKIPLQAPPPTPPPSTTPTNTTPTTPADGEGSNGGGTEPKAEPLLLDTNAASTYNPYGYPAANFGDPSLTIDGDTSTGWSAQLIPASAPNLAEGVLIDLHSAQKLGSVKLVTTTPGMTVQVFGANGNTVPASITAPAWTTLSRSIVVKKRHAHFGLRDKKKAFRFITLWISRAPASSVGTPEAPGRVTVNELELFPPSVG